MTVSGKPLLDILTGNTPSRRPLWFMRQAGRYLKEYRDLRANAGSFLDLCYNPSLAAEVTLQPVKRFDIDAAILFSDILVVPQALGSKLDFVVNEGPVLSTTQSHKDVGRLKTSGVSQMLEPVFETVKRVKKDIPEHVTFIGFCGAPWTVASYMVEGGSSDRVAARKAAFNREPWFNQLIDVLVEVSIEYLQKQVEAGVEVLQIFDSWASDLPDLEREEYCYKPIKKIVDGLRAKGITTPIIGFAKGLGPGHLEFLKFVELQAVGIEAGLELNWAKENLADKTIVQGNLDPVLLDVGGPGLERSVHHILSSLPKDRHIFNLGHGIRQTTNIDHVYKMIEFVREFDGI